MQIKIAEQFAADFKEIKDVSLHQKIKEVIDDLKKQETLEDAPYFRNIKGNDYAFKMAIGFYFLILYKTGISEYMLMRCLSRDEVLKFQLN